MNYKSTRNTNVTVTSAEAIKNGISPDGGLYVPVWCPKVTLSDIQDMSTLSYNELATNVLGKFLTDYTKEELDDCTYKAYTKEKFETKKIAPVHKLNDNEYILELWHGPTCAFKDMALQILPHLLTKAIKKTGENREVVILVATSGDTGKAALEGFKDVDGTKIQVFYPRDGVSKIQQLQMTTQDGNNVDVVAVIGNFDDAQTGVKKIFTDEEYKEKLAKSGFVFSTANSINWGRLVPQIVYYFSAYCSLLRDGEIKLGDKINICVPTGNFGNILAAYYAKLMGLPVSKLICASNSNNVLTEFISTGTYDRNRKFETTISPSMDILISSNLERFLFHASNENAALIKDYMERLSNDGKYTVDNSIKGILNDTFYAAFSTEDETTQTIKDVKSKYGYVVDTHTAVGINVYDKYVKDTGDNTKTVIASTASPFKFNEAVIEAISGEDAITGKGEFELLDILSKSGNIKIPASLSELADKKIRFTDVCEKGNLKNQTDKFLNLQ